MKRERFPTIHVSKDDNPYIVFDGTRSIKVKSDKNGVLKFELKSGNKSIAVK